MKADEILIQQIEEVSNGESCHAAANLVGAYRSAAREYQDSNDAEYREVFFEAERELRILLMRLRIRRAGFLVHWK